MAFGKGEMAAMFGKTCKGGGVCGTVNLVVERALRLGDSHLLAQLALGLDDREVVRSIEVVGFPETAHGIVVMLAFLFLRKHEHDEHYGNCNGYQFVE